VGTASVAAGLAGLTVILSVWAWTVHGGEPADVGSSRFAVPVTGSPSESPVTTATVPSFDERFSSGRSAAPLGSVAVNTVITAAPITATVAVPAAPANVVPLTAAPRVAAGTLEPHTATRSAAPKQPSAQYQVASLSDTPISDLIKKVMLRDLASHDAAPKDSAPPDAAPSNSLSGDTGHTAIYDISAHTVYLPNGVRLEAHSGLGEHIDDVRSVHLRSRGPTPPNVYELKLRESLFHGVQAIRLDPVDGGKMYGRDGILAHPFMLGPNGQSNGCVSLKDYAAFLNAYLSGEITRLVVVEQLDDPPSARTAADWFSNKLKGIFGRS